MRPPIEITKKDREEIQSMAGLGMRYADIAAIKGFSLKTLKRKCKKELSDGKRLGIMELLKSAYYLAHVKKDKTMLCFLLKTQGGLREKSHVNMTVNEKPMKDIHKREAMPNDPILAAKAYRELITRD